jgi:TPR repeat protein
MSISNQIEYETALDSMKDQSRTHDEISDLLTIAHEKGDARATYALATWYLHGTHFDKNVEKATELLIVAADSNIPEALFDLAYSYESGVGVDVDENQEFELYLKSSLLGDREALREVGRCLTYGVGTDVNERVADIFLDAAEHFGIDD